MMIKYVLDFFWDILESVVILFERIILIMKNNEFKNVFFKQVCFCVYTTVMMFSIEKHNNTCKIFFITINKMC